jgi:hypothetical protein
VAGSDVVCTVRAAPVDVALTDMIAVEASIFDAEIALVSECARTPIAGAVAASTEDLAVYAHPVGLARACSVYVFHGVFLAGYAVDWSGSGAGVTGVVAETAVGGAVCTVPVFNADAVSVHVLVAVHGAHVTGIGARAVATRATIITGADVAVAIISRPGALTGAVSAVEVRVRYAAVAVI